MKWDELPKDDESLKKLFKVDHRKNYKVQFIECCLTCDYLETGPEGSITCTMCVEIRNLAFYKYYGYTEEETKENMDADFECKYNQAWQEFVEHLAKCDLYERSKKIGGMSTEQEVIMILRGDK